MVTIRKNCFETNSSSMHSLAIVKKNRKSDKFTLELHQLGFTVALDDDPDYKSNEEKIEKIYA